MTDTSPPPFAADPAVAGDEADRWQTVARLRREHPNWVILWVARKQSYDAWRLFRAPRGTALTARTHQDMPGQMDRVEQAAGSLRRSPRQTDT